MVRRFVSPPFWLHVSLTACLDDVSLTCSVSCGDFGLGSCGSTGHCHTLCAAWRKAVPCDATHAPAE